MENVPGDAVAVVEPAELVEAIELWQDGLNDSALQEDPKSLRRRRPQGCPIGRPPGYQTWQLRQLCLVLNQRSLERLRLLMVESRDHLLHL